MRREAQARRQLVSRLTWSAIGIALLALAGYAARAVLPVLGLAGLLTSSTVNVRQFSTQFKAADVWIQRLVGGLFVLIGLNEIVLYWFL